MSAGQFRGSRGQDFSCSIPPSTLINTANGERASYPLYTPASPHFHLIHSVSAISSRKSEKQDSDSIYRFPHLSPPFSRVPCWSVLILISFSVRGKLRVSVLGFFGIRGNIILGCLIWFRLLVLFYMIFETFIVPAEILGTSFVNLLGSVNVRLDSWIFILC